MKFSLRKSTRAFFSCVREKVREKNDKRERETQVGESERKCLFNIFASRLINKIKNKKKISMKNRLPLKNYL